jgi:hypothetical protein
MEKMNEKVDEKSTENIDMKENGQKSPDARKKKDNSRYMCRFTQRGVKCQRTSCEFSHEKKTGHREKKEILKAQRENINMPQQPGEQKDSMDMKDKETTSSMNSSKNEKKIPKECYLYNEGKCRRKHCWFIHSGESASNKPRDDLNGKLNSPKNSNGGVLKHSQDINMNQWLRKPEGAK